MSSKRLAVILIAAIMVLSTAASAAPPRINPDEALKALGKPALQPSPEEDGLSIVIEEVNTTGAKDWKPGSLIIRLEAGASVSSADSELGSAIAKLGGQIEGSLNMKGRSEGASASNAGGLRFVFAKFSEDADMFELAEKVANLPGVMYAEPDYRLYPDTVALPPTDSGYTLGRQYYLNNDGVTPYYIKVATPESPSSYSLNGTIGSDLKAAAGWQFANGDFGLDCSSVVVGVIDQGVAFWHADLEANMWVNEDEFNGTEGVDDDGNGFMDDVYGYNFYHDLGINDYESGYKPGQEYDYHGTHVAGTISAEWNGWGSAGTARNAKIMSLKFLDEGGGWTSDAIRALDYAVLMGADLTTNSWGGGEPEQSLSDAIRESGMLFIAAAGNDGNNNDFFGHYPSSYANPNSPYYCSNVISVAATDANDNLVSFSNYGAGSVNIAAAGFYVYASYPVVDGDDYLSYNAWMSGTSMATPQVSAVAAMLIAQDKMHASYSLPQYVDPNPAGNWDTVKEIILNSAEKKAQLDGYVSSGGRVSMYGALTMQRLASASSITVSPGFTNDLPVDIQVSVEIDGGDAKASSVPGIEHRWELFFADGFWQRESAGVTATGLSATLTATEYGSYEVRYEMYDTVNDAVITTSYKRVLVVPEDAVLLVVDDQWYGYEDMSYMDWAAFALYGIPVFTISPPMDIPYDIPNVVFWTTTYTTVGVINEEDAQWLIGYLKHGGGRLLLASYEMLNMIDGYYGEEALSPETAEELLGLLKIEDYVTDYTYAMTGDLPLFENPSAVEGDSIIWANGLSIDLDYELWGEYMYNFGDVVTAYGPGAYPILLSEFGGQIDEPERAALGISYAGDDYRLIFLGAPLEALQGSDFFIWLIGGPWSDDIYNFLDFVWYSWEFLLGEGPDRLVSWLESPLSGGTYSNPINVEWNLQDIEGTIHEARLWYRNGSEADWEPVTLFVPGEDFEYLWNFGHTLVGDGYEVMLEVVDAEDHSRAAYDFEAPFAIWPSNVQEGARAGVDAENEEVIFYVNAEKPGILYVYDLSGVMLFSYEVHDGMQQVVWDMTFNGLRIARGLYAFRVVYNDGSASKTGRFLVNF